MHSFVALARCGSRKPCAASSEPLSGLFSRVQRADLRVQSARNEHERMPDTATLIFMLRLALKDRAQLVFENAALRQQLAVYKRSVSRRISPRSGRVSVGSHGGELVCRVGDVGQAKDASPVDARYVSHPVVICDVETMSFRAVSP